MATIVRLFFDGRPANVGERIRAIVVDAIKLMPWGWLAAKFGEKGPVIIQFKLDASASVIFPVFILWVATAFAGGGPCSPFWSWFVASPIAMASVLAANGGVFGAAAGLSATALQIGASDNMLAATIANAIPARVAEVGFNGQSSETLVNKAYNPSFAKPFASFFSKASAGLGNTHCKWASFDNLFSSAITSTKPSDYVVGTNTMERGYGKATESLIGQVVTTKFFHMKMVSQIKGFV